MNSFSQRTLFENAIRSKHPESWIERAADGGYKNAIVEYMWAGFKLANATRHKSKVDVPAQFIIARVNEYGNNVFSSAPYIHASMGAAITEAKRLHKRTGHKFNMWKRVHEIDHHPRPIEEPLITLGEALKLHEELK
jgi:hypothetical protein